VSRGLRDVIRYGPPPTLTEPGQSRSAAIAAKRSTSAPGIVAITLYAQRSISGYYLGDTGRETGGFMWGMVAERVIFIDDAVEAGEGMDRGPTWTSYDQEYFKLHERGAGRPIIGDWHTHPGQAEPEPSAADRKAWTRHAGEAGIPCASIIVGDIGSPYNPMRAFITEFRGGNSRTYPAVLATSATK
jgi:integrative and conjugative element protein (TIGR02256 family)